MKKTIEDLKTRIYHDLRVNEKCLKESTSDSISSMLKLWIKYDEELLATIKEIEISNEENI